MECKEFSTKPVIERRRILAYGQKARARPMAADGRAGTDGTMDWYAGLAAAGALLRILHLERPQTVRIRLCTIGVALLAQISC